MIGFNRNTHWFLNPSVYQEPVGYPETETETENRGTLHHSYWVQAEGE